MSASEIDAFKAQVSRCWNPPVGGIGIGSLVVKLRLKFNRDGHLAKPPQLMNGRNTPVFRAAAESAMRAVIECEPYNMPPKKYALWGDMILNFDPRDMLGGF